MITAETHQLKSATVITLLLLGPVIAWPVVPE